MPTGINQKTTPIITVHWLESSRAQRILWLLEELGVDYNIKLYHSEGRIADPALQQVFPLGKSPVVEIDYQDGKPTKKIAESGYIINFIIREFDHKNVFAKSKQPEAAEEVAYLLHYTEGTLAPYLLIPVVHNTAVSRAPFMVKSVCAKFAAAIDEQYISVNLARNLNFLENKLKNNRKSGEPGLFFVDGELSGADIILVFGMQVVFDGKRFDNSVLDRSKYPLLKEWLRQMKNRPAFKKAQERVQKEGNGKYAIFNPE